MKFSGMVINPPFEFGNKINAEVIKHLTDDGRAVIIQPLNQYKGQKLYEHIGQFELADPKLFSDAVITENLNISIVTKKKQNKYTWQQLVLESCDQNFRKFYDWNIANSRGIIMKRQDGKNPTDFNINTDFLECGRLFAAAGGAGFGIGSIGYKWNTMHWQNSDNWIFNIGLISLSSNNAKQNFVKYWYNGKKGDKLASKVALGLHITNANGTGFFIPQIDWDTIDQHPLWNIDVDEAVLDTMGLKWNNNKTMIMRLMEQDFNLTQI